MCTCPPRRHCPRDNGLSAPQVSMRRGPPVLRRFPMRIPATPGKTLVAPQGCRSQDRVYSCPIGRSRRPDTDHWGSAVSTRPDRRSSNLERRLVRPDTNRRGSAVYNRHHRSVHMCRCYRSRPRDTNHWGPHHMGSARCRARNRPPEYTRSQAHNNQRDPRDCTIRLRPRMYRRHRSFLRDNSGLGMGLRER